MDELIKKIREKIRGRYSEDSRRILDDGNGEASEIRKENFHEIPHIDSKKMIAFVDGGYAEILKAPSFSVFMVRVYYSVYKKNRRVMFDRHEFFALASAHAEKGMLVYSTEYFPGKNLLGLNRYSFNPYDKKITYGDKRASISSIGNVIRRFSELAAANSISADFVVIDGSLDKTYPHEEEIELKKNIFGLSKTTEMLTDMGDTAASFIGRKADKDTWYYKNNLNYFVRLHPCSGYVFRFDASKDEEVGEVLSLLKENSKDPVYPGYPYGLVEADKMARVSNREREMQEMAVRIKLKKDIEKIQPYLNSVNAHSILDNM